MEQGIAHLEDRIDRLSAQSRRQQVWLVMLSIVLGAVTLVAAHEPKPDVLRAQRFEAIDQDGKVLAVLTSKWKWGAPALALLDDRGEDFAFLTMMDATIEGTAEKMKVAMLQMEANGVASDHYGMATLCATARGGALNLSHSDDECISLGINESRMGLRIEHDGKPPLLDLQSEGDAVALEIRDGEGKSLFRAP